MTPRRALTVGIILIVLCCVAAKLRAQEPGRTDANGTSVEAYKLVPYPKEIKKLDGAFTIGGGTRIIVNSAHAQEDRVAAETLAAEIQNATGQKPRIVTGRGPANGAIYLSRLTDDRGLRSTFAGKGLTTDDTFDSEGYVLQATRDRVIVGGQSGAGLFYGVQTLRQMVQRGDSKRASVPAVAIKDWPTMRWRGVHDDISRGPVPTLDYMKKQVRTLAEYKMNMFSLYIEHVFDYESEPLVAPKEGSLNAKEVKELVEYAKKYHVEIVPEQQAFGHLHHVLKTEKFSDMAETSHGHVLTPTSEKSYEFINRMYSELVPLFPAPLFHIGADETFELGRGQTAERVEQVGLGRVYLEHLKRVTEILKPYNKRLMFWGDIAVHYPELLGILPKNVIAVPWNYSARPNFDSMLKPYKDAGLDLMVAPGANNWNMIYPNMTEAFGNIRNFVRDGQKYGAMGMLNTTWDDDGEALFEMTWPALVFGAAASWQNGESSIDQFQNSYDWAFYRNTDATFMDAVKNLNRAHELLNSVGAGRGANNQALWTDAFSEYGAKSTEKALPIARELRLSAEAALESLYKYRAKAKVHDETLDAMIMAGHRLDLLGMKIQFSAEISRAYWDAFLNQGDRARVNRDLREIDAVNARLQDLRDATNRVRGMYEKTWLAENRPYWLQNVLVRYDVMAQGYQQKINAMKGAQAQYFEKGALPSPESMGFYIRPEAPAPKAAMKAVGR